MKNEYVVTRKLYVSWTKENMNQGAPKASKIVWVISAVAAPRKMVCLLMVILLVRLFRNIAKNTANAHCIRCVPIVGSPAAPVAGGSSN